MSNTDIAVTPKGKIQAKDDKIKQLYEEISQKDFLCQINWNLISISFEINGGLRRIW
jgi:hypothetical protein